MFAPNTTKTRTKRKALAASSPFKMTGLRRRRRRRLGLAPGAVLATNGGATDMRSTWF